MALTENLTHGGFIGLGISHANPFHHALAYLVEEHGTGRQFLFEGIPASSILNHDLREVNGGVGVAAGRRDG